MSTSKAEKEKLQLIQEKSQQILSELLKDEDNKYCVDCDAKGPRWASWNIGVFLCIRCAGIHRNLGVHISKVKSVNLDSWSPEQVAYMQLMGNSKARAVYEANLPDNFKRPQADSGLEAFVRAKYEQKKYIAKEWVPPANPKPAFDIEEERKKEKEKKRNKIVKGQTNSAIVEVQTNPVPRPHSSPASTAINAEKVLNNKNGSNGIKPPSSDLLGLNTSSKSNASDDDGFDAFVSCAPVSAGSKPTGDDLVNVSSDTKSASGGKTNEEEDFFSQKAPEQKRLDKESILKLYESSNPVPNQLFNLTGSTPLQPMNLNGGGGGGQFSNRLAPANGINNALLNNPLSSHSLFPSANTISNGFANFGQPPPPAASNQLSQQPPPFLAFNQTNTIPNSTTISSTNPFLNAPAATNGTTPHLASTDLFSSSNLQSVSTLESQLNGLNFQSSLPVNVQTNVQTNLSNTDTLSSISWPTNNNISTGQSLFSANFDNLNSSPSDKKLNGVLPPASISAANPFMANTTPIQTNSSNLDLLSAFGSTPTANGLNNLANLNGLNKSNSENWSTLHTTPTNNGLTSGLADIWQ